MTFKKFAPYLTALFFGVIVFLLYESLSAIDFNLVRKGLGEISPRIILLAFGLVLLDYSILASYDCLSFKSQNFKDVGLSKIFVSAFICYAVTLNLGALVGGLGMRYRIYGQWNISKARIPAIIAISTASNWLGYCFLFGLTCLSSAADIDKLTGLSATVVILLGALFLAIVASYFYLSFRGSTLNIRNHTYKVPKLSIAGVQLALSTVQWMLLGFILYSIFRGIGAEVKYSDIIFTLLVSSVMGVVTHLPAGLGVLEAAFLKMNFGVSQDKILVGLICYRVVYYFIPLMMAIPTYLGVEFYQKRWRGSSIRNSAP